MSHRVPLAKRKTHIIGAIEHFWAGVEGGRGRILVELYLADVYGFGRTVLVIQEVWLNWEPVCVG